ncbi:MAG: pantetheine-phosphate adenylyltransferase [Actinomycetes bacterium]|nr:pantetheine-phosphate adenylyltransferase [Actinomycetes bacterium]MDX5380969.1 pantetheine-phosphate adenylyltransferase [Actinomycetes bacterium]MDX5400105.1 pantetheine-phosphate adenylyltransferase [Actinomycetes bacterium]MDX5450730.1 pantetheine-phosphate adenylyltransferase [Actinomycetes bacterium]
MRSLAVCPGSFDPITFGHVDVVKRALSLFDEVIVAVANNASKTHLLDSDQRVMLTRQALQGIEGVSVEPVTGLLADFCTERDARAIVKGLRGSADFDDEMSMSLLNRHLSGIETVFIMGDPSLNHVSSSMVKEIARYGGDVTGLVPEAVARSLMRSKG